MKKQGNKRNGAKVFLVAVACVGMTVMAGCEDQGLQDLSKRVSSLETEIVALQKKSTVMSDNIEKIKKSLVDTAVTMPTERPAEEVSTTTPTPAAVPSPTQAPVAQTPTPRPTPTPSVQVARVNAGSGLNLREKASLDSDVVRVLAFEEVVTLTGQSIIESGSEWVEINGGGWVLLEYLLVE
tara:strand:- start:1518 stop:2063 length:546 start_codon:yes stop_codon:yes gene_type:complete